MRPFFYILDPTGERPIPAKSITEFAMWSAYSGKQFQVSREPICDGEVSTVFLGLNLDFSGAAAPILWETMVFGGRMDEYQERCSGNREQAEAMHARVCDMVRLAHEVAELEQAES